MQWDWTREPYHLEVSLTATCTYCQSCKTSPVDSSTFTVATPFLLQALRIHFVGFYIHILSLVFWRHPTQTYSVVVCLLWLSHVLSLLADHWKKKLLMLSLAFSLISLTFYIASKYSIFYMLVCIWWWGPTQLWLKTCCDVCVYPVNWVHLYNH